MQFRRVGERKDGWHTDGGASLLHGALTVWEAVHSKSSRKGGCISLPQKPGSFYVGNLCALEHNVEHCAESAGCYGVGPPSEQAQIAVMLRTDAFSRSAREKSMPSQGQRSCSISLILRRRSIWQSSLSTSLTSTPYSQNLEQQGATVCRRSAMVCCCISPFQPRIHRFERGLHQPPRIECPES